MAPSQPAIPFERVTRNLLILDGEMRVVSPGDGIRERLFSSDPVPEFFPDGFPSEEKEKIREALKQLLRDGEPVRLSINNQRFYFHRQGQDAHPLILGFLDDRKKKGRKDDINTLGQHLKERIKELSCLYNTSNAIDKASTLEEAITSSLPILQQGFQYPGITNVTFVLDGKAYTLRENFPTEKQSISSDIMVHGEKRGGLRIGYSQDRSFIPEEEQLLREISYSFSKTIERVESRKDLEKQKKILLRKNRKLIELSEECGENQKKLKALLKAMEGRLIVIDRDRRIILSNRKNIRESDTCYHALFQRKDVCSNCPLDKVFNDNRSVSVEKKFDRGYFNLQFFPIMNEKDEVENVLEICNDVTKEKNMEFQLIQSYKLASLGKLVAGIAHEINNPNTFIRGNIKIIKEAFQDILPLLEERYREDETMKIARLDFPVFRENIPVLIDDMVEGSERIKKIVYGLRNYARKDEGALNDKVNINQVIESSLRLVHNQIRKTATVQKKLAEDLPSIQGNIQKLEQVMVNLLVNASQAIPENQRGVIKIMTDFHSKSGEIIVMISDNGQGMDEKTRKSIFDPFFTTKRARGGTGLGLSISYGIIKEHNGRVMVSSKKGEGTVFTINLPRGKK